MARRVPPTTANEALGAPAPAEVPGVPPPAMPGGSAGVMMSPTTLDMASKKIHFPGVAEAQAATDENAPEVEVERFEVIDAPNVPGKPEGYPIVLNGAIGYLRNGKVIDQTTYDIDALRRQGVKLKSLNPPKEAEKA